MFPASKNVKLWGGGTPSKQRVIEKKFFYFFIVAEIRSDETPSIFNFKKGEIMKHPNHEPKIFVRALGRIHASEDQIGIML